MTIKLKRLKSKGFNFIAKYITETLEYYETEYDENDIYYNYSVIWENTRDKEINIVFSVWNGEELIPFSAETLHRDNNEIEFDNIYNECINNKIELAVEVV